MHGSFAVGILLCILLLAKQTLGVGKAQHPKTRPAHLIFTVQGVEAKTLLTSLIHFAASFTVSLCRFIYYIFVRQRSVFFCEITVGICSIQRTFFGHFRSRHFYAKRSGGVLPKCLRLDSSTGIITWTLSVLWQQVGNKFLLATAHGSRISLAPKLTG